MSLDAGSVFATLGGNFNPSGFLAFDSAMKRAGTQATGFERDLVSSQRRSSAAVTAFGTAARTGGAAGVAAMGLAVVKSVSIYADYEKRLSGLKAVSGATAGEMKKLETQARDLGKSTAYSAREVVQAQTELVKGGVSIKDVLTGAADGALALAAAGEMELADAATTVANALNVFKMEGEDAGHVADVLAQAANNTTADVHDFALALTQGGAAAKLAGMDFDQTVVALETLAMAGVKGSDAGTSLKAALTQIANPSKEAKEEMNRLGLEFFNSEGKIKSVAQMSGELRRELGGMTEEQRLATLTTIAGTDGMRALAAMYDSGADSARRLTESHKEVGTAAEVAKAKQDNLTGDMEKLGGAAEEAALQLGEALGPELREMVQDFTDAVSELVDSGVVADFGKDLAENLDQITSVVAPAVGAIDDILVKYRELRDFDIGGVKPVDIGLDMATDPVGGLLERLEEVKAAAADVGPAVSNGISAGMAAASDKVLGLASSVLGALADITEAGNDLTPGKIGDIDTSGVRDAQRDIDELRERARTPLALRFDLKDGSKADQNIRELVERMDTLGKKKVALKIASNADDEVGAMAALSAAVQGVPTKWVTRIQNNAKDSRTEVAAYSAVIQGVPPEKVLRIIQNADSARGAVAGLAAAVNSIPSSRSISIQVKASLTGSMAAIQAAMGNRLKARAAGRGAEGAEAAIIGEGKGPEWRVDSLTGDAVKVTEPTLVDLQPQDYVIPTEPQFRGRAWGLLAMLAGDLGLPMYAGGRGAKKPKAKSKPKAKRKVPAPREIFRGSPDELGQVADNATDRLEDAKRAAEDRYTKGKNKGKRTKAAKAAYDKIPELREEARRRRQIAREAQRHADRITAADEEAEIARTDMERADRKDDQPAYDKAKGRREKSIKRSITLLREALKYAPKGSAWERQIRKALGEAQLAGVDAASEAMSVDEPEETAEQKAAREAAERLFDTGMTDAERARLAELEKNEALAALTEGLDDDKAAAGAKTSFLEAILGMAQADPARGGAPAIRDIAEAVARAKGNLASLTGSTAVNDNGDVQAQIEQAKQAGFAAGLGRRIDDAAAGVFGPSPSITIQTLHPGDSRTLDAIGAAATAGIGQQSFRRSNRENIGV